MTFTRRTLLAAAGAAVPAALVSGTAQAWTEVQVRPAAVGIEPPTGLWRVLERVTDGTDPSLLAIDEPPRFTPEIRALADTAIELSGWLQPAATTGLVETGHVLSRLPLHCAVCYPGGRGSLAFVAFDGAPPAMPEGRVTVAGTLRLVEQAEPADFAFRLDGARITVA